MRDAIFQIQVLFIVHTPPLSLFSCISIGTRIGYKIYTCDPFGKCYGKSKENVVMKEKGLLWNGFDIISDII